MTPTGKDPTHAAKARQGPQGPPGSARGISTLRVVFPGVPLTAAPTGFRCARFGGTPGSALPANPQNPDAKLARSPQEDT